MTTRAVLERLHAIGPIFRSKQAVDAGVSWRDLYRLRDEGELLELSRGLFQLAASAGMANIDFVAVCGRAPHGMVCLGSALSYWDLSDEIPREVHLAVPEGSHRPTIDYPPTQVHVFRARTFDLGRTKISPEDGGHFWISDRERTVVDAFRLRHRIGEDLAHGALRRYLQQRPRPGRLSDLGRQLRAGSALADAIRVLAE